MEDEGSRVTRDDATPGPGKAWSRTAVIAGGVTIIILVLLLLFVGIPTAEGVGRVVGMNVFPYVLTALIVRNRPRLMRWGPLTAVYLALFLVFLVIRGVGALSSG